MGSLRALAFAVHVAGIVFASVGFGFVFCADSSVRRRASIGGWCWNRVRLAAFLCGAGDFNLWSILCSRNGLPLFLCGAYSFGGAIFFSFGRIFLRGGLSVLPDAMRSLHCNGETPFNAVFSKIRKMDRVRVLRLFVDVFLGSIIAQASLRIE